MSEPKLGMAPSHGTGVQGSSTGASAANVRAWVPSQRVGTGIINPDREVRIAVVLYGGVSLAVYINGVTQELLRVVRATAPSAPLLQAAGEPLISDADLRPLDAVYRELGRRVGSADPLAESLSPEMHGHVRTRFVVDVLSGTSAGGINGVFLAKALANVLMLDELRNLWLSEGDLARLLNDRGTVKDPPRGTEPQSPPRALLNSRRMYYLLLDALKGLERGQERERQLSGRVPPPVSPLVDELDLYVTATDLAGLTLPITLWDRTVFEQRHRNVFRFRYASERASGTRRNDFEEKMNPFLAFAARCTSSFPVAFEPMRLDDIVGVKGGPADAKALAKNMHVWADFFRDYLEAPGAGPNAAAEFSRRSFGDGGYLDNKPFSYATSVLRTRRADCRVERKLFYVEPSPEHPELDAPSTASADRPDAFANLAAAAVDLPRAETIREDIERVLERNRLLERIERAVGHVDADLAAGASQTPRDDPEFGDQGLKRMVGLYGPSYGAYHRLRVSQATTDLAELFCRMAGFDESSTLAVAMRFVVEAWREDAYVRDPEDAVGNRSAARTENRFLLEHDFAFRVRRLRFLQERLDTLLAVAEREGRREADAARDRDREADDARLDNEAWRAARRESRRLRAEQRERESEDDHRTVMAIFMPSLDSPVVGDAVLAARNRQALVAAVLELKAAISSVQVELRKAGRELRSRAPDNPIREGILGLGVSLGELQWLLNAPGDDERRARAAELLGQPQGRATAVQAVMNALGARMADIRARANGRLDEILDVKWPGAVDGGGEIRAFEPPPTVREILRLALTGLFKRFVSYDLVLLPLMYGTDSGEAARVDIVRVSPEDATSLIAERDLGDGTRRVYKLAGTRFGDFGAFFEKRWRTSDMLWGRLDGSERIIRAMLVPRDKGEEQVLDQLVLRAQAAIVSEETRELDPEEARRLMVECLMRTTSSKAEPGLLAGMMDRLLPVLRTLDPATADKLDLDRMRTEYLRAFDRDRDLAPDQGAPLFARATQIFGHLLDGLSNRYGPLSGKAGAWLVWLGRIAWGLVEIALPRTWGALLARYWLNLVYLLSVISLASGMLFAWNAMRALGMRLLLIALGVDLVRWMARGLLTRKLTLKGVLLAVGLPLALVGLATLLLNVPALEHWADRQFTTVMDFFSPWLGWVRSIGAWLCPKC